MAAQIQIVDPGGHGVRLSLQMGNGTVEYGKGLADSGASATCPYPNVQRSTRIWERIVGAAAARQRELVAGAAPRECAAERDILAMAAMDRWAVTNLICASKMKVNLFI